MVTVSFLRDQRNKIIGFRAKGHAGRGKYGRDIVCAGISALLLTTVSGLTNVVKLKPLSCNAKNGELLFLLSDSVKGQEKHDAGILFNTLLCGLRAIQNEYPGSIRIYEKAYGST